MKPYDKKDLAADQARIIELLHELGFEDQTDSVVNDIAFNIREKRAIQSWIENSFNDSGANCKVVERKLESDLQAFNEFQALHARVREYKLESDTRPTFVEVYFEVLGTLISVFSFDLKRDRIQRPPGHVILKLAELFAGPAKYKQVCETVMADWHAEYFEALKQDRGWFKLLCIRIRHTYDFFKMLGLLSFFRWIGQMIGKVTGAGSD